METFQPPLHCQILGVFLCVILGSQLVVSQQQTKDLKKDVTANNLGNATTCLVDGKAKFCLTPFMELAFLRKPNVTSTCGLKGPATYCILTSSQSSPSTDDYCDECDASRVEKAHPASYLTDFNLEHPRRTFWQSESLEERGQSTSRFQVNITFDLGIQSQVTYIWLRFQSPRPHSMRILRRKSRDSDWEPWAYFSQNCEAMYSMPSDARVMPENRTDPICSSKYSDIVPLVDANVPIPLIVDRFSKSPMKNFWKDSQLQDWVLASNIRIVLDKLNTHGDLIRSDVFKRYFYAIYDISIGGRCHCHGHASTCTTDSLTQMKKCECSHQTTGNQCERCIDNYNDRPWQAATEENSWECKPCNCSGNSEFCEFDLDLYQKSGNVSGGRCTNCRGNTQGAHCEQCLPNYRRQSAGSNQCVACNCHPIGSITLQCDQTGACSCRPGVVGEKCDRCQVGNYNLSDAGCQSCGCSPEGTDAKAGTCDPLTGSCSCKPNVIGRRCDTCRPGHFGLRADDPDGCQRCFCYGHTSNCSSLQGMARTEITEKFSASSSAQSLDYGFRFLLTSSSKQTRFSAKAALSSFPMTHLNASRIEVAPENDSLYILLPPRMLSNQSASFNRFLRLEVEFSDVPTDRRCAADVVLVSDSIQFAASISLSEMRKGRNSLRFRLSHDMASTMWRPFSAPQSLFRQLLAAITEIRVCALYNNADKRRVNVKLFEVTLESAAYSSSRSVMAALNLHQCSCPANYSGNFCENCAAGFTREIPSSNSFGKCVRCQCNGHSDTCDPQTGSCNNGKSDNNKNVAICRNNTDGLKCEKCARGYYGNATDGSPGDCQKCPCPGSTSCKWDSTLSVAVCTQCPTGLAGINCGSCALGFFGLAPNCSRCDCSNNTDRNDFQVCDRINGECRKCIDNTGGKKCDICKNGFHGNALAPGGAQCKSCGCDLNGTESDQTCNHRTGECRCKLNVSGRKCDTCRAGYFNISSQSGCQDCACNFTGTNGRASCDIVTGQCSCQSGIVGRACDQCRRGFFGFSNSGCQPCNCNAVGTDPEFLNECDNSGNCRCKQNVVGAKCDKCSENRFNLSAGCLECPSCYGVVQNMVQDLSNQLTSIEGLFNESANINLGDASDRISRVNATAHNLLQRLKVAVGGSLKDTNLRLLQQLHSNITISLAKFDVAVKNITQLEIFVNSEFPNQKIQIWKKVNESNEGIQQVQKKLQETLDIHSNFLNVRNRINQMNKEFEAKRQGIEAAYFEVNGQIQQLEQQLRNSSLQSSELKNKTTSAAEILNDVSSQSKILMNEIDKLEIKAKQVKSQLNDSFQLASRFRSELHSISAMLIGNQPNVTSLNNSISELQDRTKEVDAKYAAAEVAFANARRQLETAVANATNQFKQQKEFNEKLNNFHQYLTQKQNYINQMKSFCNETFNSAKQLLASLQNYEKALNQSAAEANEAIKELDEIKLKIARAEQNNNNTRVILDKHEGLLSSASQQLADSESKAKGFVDKAKIIATAAAGNLSEAATSHKDMQALYESLSQMESRLGNVMQRQEETEKQLELLSENSGKAKLDAENMTARFNQLKNNLQNLSNINNNKNFDEEVAKLNATISSLAGKIGEDDIDGELGLKLDTIKRLQLEQDENVKEIQWLQREHQRLTDVADELNKYIDSNCYYVLPKSIS